MTSETDTTILIVDDAPESLSVLRKLLWPKYRVLAAASGAGGLRVAGNLPKPDLILLDVMMPDMDGFEVLAQLHNNPATRDIPVIFLTALANTCDEERRRLHAPRKPATIFCARKAMCSDWPRD